jgi:hypothetical protein
MFLILCLFSIIILITYFTHFEYTIIFFFFYIEYTIILLGIKRFLPSFSPVCCIALDSLFVQKEFEVNMFDGRHMSVDSWYIKRCVYFGFFWEKIFFFLKKIHFIILLVFVIDFFKNYFFKKIIFNPKMKSYF